MPVTQVKTTKDFEKMKGSSDLTVIDYFADWCGPCKMMSPFFDQLSNSDEYKSVNFCQVDVDALPEVAASEEIEAMPTFIFYKNGSKLEALVGANKKLLDTTLKRLAN